MVSFIFIFGFRLLRFSFGLFLLPCGLGDSSQPLLFLIFFACAVGRFLIIFLPTTRSFLYLLPLTFPDESLGTSAIGLPEKIIDIPEVNRWRHLGSHTAFFFVSL